MRRISQQNITTEFTHFYPGSFQFLENLQKNNNKNWFIEHKEEYEELLLYPLKAMVNELAGFMLEIDPQFETKAVINKTISRIYRDIRFSRNRSPLKTKMWITFKRNRQNWKSLPAFYFEIQPYKYFYGMGFFKAEPSYMEKFRYVIDKNNQKFLSVISFMDEPETANIFQLEGKDYKKQHTKHSSKTITPWYCKKTFHLVKYNTKSAMDINFLDHLKKDFELLAPLYNYLSEIDQIRL